MYVYCLLDSAWNTSLAFKIDGQQVGTFTFNTDQFPGEITPGHLVYANTSMGPEAVHLFELVHVGLPDPGAKSEVFLDFLMYTYVARPGSASPFRRARGAYSPAPFASQARTRRRAHLIRVLRNLHPAPLHRNRNHIPRLQHLVISTRADARAN